MFENKNISKLAHVIAFVSLAFAFSCEFELLHENIDPNSGPVTVAFEIDSISNSGYDPSLVFFQNNSTGGTIYTWNFGDPASGGNNNSSDKSPSHLYQNPGVYTVSLKVENNQTNEEKSLSMDITILETHTFTRTMSEVGTRFARLWDALVLENGNYLMVGGSGTSDDIELYVHQVNEEGFGISGFPKKIDITGSIEGFSAIQNSSGNVVVTGLTNTGSFNDAKVALFQLDNNMNIRSGYPKNYGASTRGSGQSIIQTQSGGYALAGGIGGPGGSDFFVTMTDGNGTELSNFPRTYNEFDFTEQANAIQQLDNGEFILVGTDVTLGRLFINRMDVNGNDLPGSPFYVDGRSGNDFIVLPDGSLMIVGRELNRIDLNGNDFPGFPKDMGNQFYGLDIMITREGDVVFVGQDDDDLVLYKTDFNGNTLPGFPKSFPKTNRTVANAVTQTPDGGFLIVGTEFSSNSKGYIVKTDSEGVLR